MADFFSNPWPWYVAGPLIAFCMAALLFAGKRFGVSSNFQTLCTLAGAGRFSDFFRIDWRERKWNLTFLLGAVIGGAISGLWLRPDAAVDLAPDTVETLKSWGMEQPGATFEPRELYGPEVWGQPGTWMILLVGGFLVGFGTRWADGCTSGHAISGLSSLQLPSLIAVIGFFIGGLTATHLILPYLFS
jgi:uncharacterized membrane protein YedE/YeeE